ncbi:MAG: prephenate dehydratase [Bacteroidota bacterium]
MTTKVAIQGYPGAFHELAARYFYDDRSLEIVPADTFEDMIGLVEKQRNAHVGMMAIENTLTGSLLNNYRLLDKSNLQVTGEVYLRIRQNLMVLPGQRLEDLREVHSHPVAIDQCLEFFKQYPKVRLIKMEDTALAAKKIREQQLKDVGAIASTTAADVYELDIIAPGIETNKKNFTRFLALEHRDSIVDHQFNKVSISFTVRHEVGSLHIVLAALAINKANLSKIQSVPIVGRGWEYMIFIDFVLEDPSRFEATIDSLRHLTDDLKILGTYLKGNHYEG